MILGHLSFAIKMKFNLYYVIGLVHTISFCRNASLLAETDGPTNDSSNINPKLYTSSSNFVICLHAWIPHSYMFVQNTKAMFGPESRRKENKEFLKKNLMIGHHEKRQEKDNTKEKRRKNAKRFPFLYLP